MANFNELEQRILRFLKDEFLEKGQAVTLTDPVTKHDDVMNKFGLSLPQYREVMARFQTLGIVNVVAIEAENGFVESDPKIVEIVRQLDDKAKEVPNRMEQAKQWGYSKPWFVGGLICLAAITVIVGFIANLKTILGWFGVQ